MQPPFHPAASAYPLMTEAELNDLTEDIRTSTVRMPVWRYKGLIIDGRNRWLACQKLGIVPPEKEYEGTEEDLPAFIESLNEHRRHLSPEWLAKRRQERIIEAARMSREGKPQREIASTLGVSQQQVKEDLKAAVEKGFSTEPEDGTIAGKDGKKYSAKKRKSANKKAAEEAKARLAAAQHPGAATRAAAADRLARQREPGDDDDEIGNPKARPSVRNGTPVGPADCDQHEEESPAPPPAEPKGTAAKGLAALGVVIRALDEFKLFKKHEKALTAIKADLMAQKGAGRG